MAGTIMVVPLWHDCGTTFRHANDPLYAAHPDGRAYRPG
jgi:hypothetical protein